MIWLGANSVLTRIEGEKDTGGTAPRPVRIRSIRSEMARTIRGAGLHIGAVHLLKEGYQVIHSSLRGMLSCTAAGKYLE